MKEIILILLLPISCFAQKNNTGNIAWIDAKLDITLLIDFDYYKNGQLFKMPINGGASTPLGTE